MWGAKCLDPAPPAPRFPAALYADVLRWLDGLSCNIPVCKNAESTIRLLLYSFTLFMIKYAFCTATRSVNKPPDRLAAPFAFLHPHAVHNPDAQPNIAWVRTIEAKNGLSKV